MAANFLSRSIEESGVAAEAIPHIIRGIGQEIEVKEN